MPHRLRTITAGAVLAVLACATPASARIIEVGGSSSEATPSCPDRPCQAVSRTTGYQVRIQGRRGTYIVPRDGRIVAWTIGLGAPNERQIEFFNENFGEATAGLAILRAGKKLRRRVKGQSPLVQLAPYFGQRVQFPLSTSLSVKKGNIVALTVPTWAPALTRLTEGASWRASRGKGKCDDTDSQTAQTRLLQRTQYACPYQARLTYSATLITTPTPNKTP